MKKIILFASLFLLSIPASFAFTPEPSLPVPDPGRFHPPVMTPPPPETTPPEAEPCTAHPISIDPRAYGSLTTITDTFEHYADSGSVYYYPPRNEYQLCFEYTSDDFVVVETPLTFTRLGELGRSVIIKGLKLKDSLTSEAYLLTVRNTDATAKIILNNIDLIDLNYGLFLSGAGQIDLINSKLSGTDTNIEPQSCLLLESNNSKIISNEISNCYYGINNNGGRGNQIGADSPATFNAKANNIHDNKIGIYIQGGERNKCSLNKVYNNKQLTAFFTSDDAIFYEPAFLGMLADLGMEVPKRPELLLINEETKEAMHCKKDLEGRITERWLEFNPLKVEVGDEIIVYETNESNQAFNYFTNCVIRDGGKCVLTTIPTTHTFDECKVLPEIYITALINHPLYTSALTEKVGDLRGPVVAIGVSGLGDVPDTPGVLEEGAAATAETGIGSKGGCGGGSGATIVPPSMETMITGLGMWWIITAVPVAILLVVRIRKRK